MKILIPKNVDFEYEKCYELYKINQRLINDNASFNDVIQNTFFYSFYNNQELIGCIYLYYVNNKLFFNGFAKRKYFSLKIQAVKTIFEWFNCDIYAESIQKPAILLLLRCGFKKINKNLYVHYNG